MIDLVLTLFAAFFNHSLFLTKAIKDYLSVGKTYSSVQPPNNNPIVRLAAILASQGKTSVATNPSSNM